MQGAGSNSGRALEAAAWDGFAEANREPVQHLGITFRKGGSSASNVFPLLSSHPRSYELLIIIFTAQLTIASYIFCPWELSVQSASKNCQVFRPKAHTGTS